MDEKSNQWIGNIRALLHDTQPNAHKIIRAIQQQPNARAREVAERYALDHFLHIKSQIYTPDDEPRRTGQIQYNHTSGALTPLTDEASQQACCLMDRCWDDLNPMALHDPARRCAMCERMVYKAGELTLEQAHQLAQHNPSIHLHLDPTYDNNVSHFTIWPKTVIVPVSTHQEKSGLRAWLRSRLGGRRAPDATTSSYASTGFLPRTIRRTCSTLDINAAAVMGYRPVIERGDTRAWFEGGQFIQVWQNTRTGEISVQKDTRYALLRPPFVEWQIACIGAYYDPQKRIGTPFSAYLIPADLPPNSKVHLQDGFTAFWNGTSLEQKRYLG